MIKIGFNIAVCRTVALESVNKFSSILLFVSGPESYEVNRLPLTQAKILHTAPYIRALHAILDEEINRIFAD